jgi:hypothetical protein
MKIVDIAEATAPLASYTSDIQQEPVIVTINGKPIAALWLLRMRTLKRSL